jgi:putative transposase
MKSKDLSDLFAGLGIARSFSRPHVSDDNAFSEAQFKTLKYQPDYPGEFASPMHARGWCQQFFGWFNDEHQHSGLALFTPADVFHGCVDEGVARRQAALDRAYEANPERFPNGAPSSRARRSPSASTRSPLSVEPPPRTQIAPHAAAKTPRPVARRHEERAAVVGRGQSILGSPIIGVDFVNPEGLVG